MLLTRIVSATNHKKSVSLNFLKCMSQPILINLRPTEYSQESRYYLFSVNLEICAGSCFTLYNLSCRVCAPNKIEDLNLNVFNMITGIN